MIYLPLSLLYFCNLPAICYNHNFFFVNIRTFSQYGPTPIHLRKSRINTLTWLPDLTKSRPIGRLLTSGARTCCDGRPIVAITIIVRETKFLLPSTILHYPHLGYGVGSKREVSISSRSVTKKLIKFLQLPSRSDILTSLFTVFLQQNTNI